MKKINYRGVNSSTPNYAKAGSSSGKPSTERYKASKKNPATMSRLGV
jgi:hypothetical protein